MDRQKEAKSMLSVFLMFHALWAFYDRNFFSIHLDVQFAWLISLLEKYWDTCHVFTLITRTVSTTGSCVPSRVHRVWSRSSQLYSRATNACSRIQRFQQETGKLRNVLVATILKRELMWDWCACVTITLALVLASAGQGSSFPFAAEVQHLRACFCFFLCVFVFRVHLSPTH